MRPQLVQKPPIRSSKQDKYRDVGFSSVPSLILFTEELSINHPEPSYPLGVVAPGEEHQSDASAWDAVGQHESGVTLGVGIFQMTRRAFIRTDLHIGI